ncbi:MAG: hypothetical protein AAF716_19660 [Cyanobacteria bacterium P01_D01_bin.1]
MEKRTDKLEIATHLILVLIGVIVLFCAAYTNTTSAFLRPLLMNIGSSLIVTTMVFSIFETFRRENESQNQTGLDMTAVNQKDKVEEKEAVLKRNELLSLQTEALAAKDRGIVRHRRQ